MVIVAVAFVVILAFLAIIFDAANGMRTRRQMQDAGDAAALAAANVVQVGSPRGCSAASNTTPRASVAQAARDSLAANLPGYDASNAVITCPAGYENHAVAVELNAVSARFFGGIVGGTLDIRTRSAAVNGQVTGTNYSIVLLDPSNGSWPQGRRGCPSLLLSGGPTVTLEGSVAINSACTAANGGALGTNGNAASVTMTNDARIRLVGGFAPGPLTISPAPITGVPAVRDPLAGLPPIDVAAMPERSGSRKVINNAVEVLRPGVYVGGIQLKNSAVALLEPGIYVLSGGGLDVGAQASVLSVPQGVSTVPTDWLATCQPGTCGVLIYNTGTTGTMGQISVGAGATLRMRAYDPSAQIGGTVDYRNLLIWQSAAPAPTSSYAQPEVALGGGGTVDIRGTVYAPSAKVSMSGGAGGSGGAPTQLTLQFITWDLELIGNSNFTFYFRDSDFARPTTYGLVN